MKRLVASKVLGDKAITSASGSGIPGRFRFFFDGGGVVESAIGGEVFF